MQKNKKILLMIAFSVLIVGVIAFIIPKSSPPVSDNDPLLKRGVETAGFKKAISDYYLIFGSREEQEKCPILQDRDYKAYPTDLNGDGVEEYIVTIKDFCGHPVRSASGGYGDFLILAKNGESYNDIGVISGRVFAVGKVKVNGYNTIFTSEKYDTIHQRIREWEWNESSSKYEEAKTGFSLLLESRHDQGFIYQFYAGDDYSSQTSELLREVESLIPADFNGGIDRERYFRKDVTSDGVPEIFVKLAENTGNVTSYKILRWQNNSLVDLNLPYN